MDQDKVKDDRLTGQVNVLHFLRGFTTRIDTASTRGVSAVSTASGILKESTRGPPSDLAPTAEVPS